jgi:integrase
MMKSVKKSLKTYQNKDRIYQKHPHIKGLSKLLLWDPRANEYKTPENGRVWIARKTCADTFGKQERVQTTFGTFDEALEWLKTRTERSTVDKVGTESDQNPSSKALGTFDTCPKDKSFKHLVSEFKRRRYPKLARGTQHHYDQLLRLHFEPLMKLSVSEILPRTIDSWIDGLIENIHRYPQARLRKSFSKELTLLGVILRFHHDHEDEVGFSFPIKPRHRKAVVLRADSESSDRDLSYEEFEAVAKAFTEIAGKNAAVIRVLFVLQFRQALRISEAAAVHWEDLKLEFRNPSQSVIKICRHIEFSRIAGVESRISAGFKNSKGMGGIKEQPLFPESFQALKELHYLGCKGLVFQDEKGDFFSYRSIQAAYKQAFERAGVVYQGTHQLRHGGCRLVYNRTADLAVASQILGNLDAETIKVYAKRDKRALTDVAQKEWESVTFANVGE